MADHQPAHQENHFLVTSQKINQYLNLLKNQGSSRATIKRKKASLAKFADWVKKEYGRQEEALKAVSPEPKKNQKISSLEETYKIDKKTSPLFKYFSFFIIALLIGSLGWGIYTQFIARPPKEPSLAALPTLPPNLISFQGRLTNSVGTPIHATVSASFKIYGVDEGGSSLWSETKDITTNPDGIFNTMLGSSNPIDPSIFADNVNLWLGITISGDDEMEPRQQIATVGYAYNSRFLQGYSASSSATAETIPVINADGDLVLASPSPTIEALSGSFGLKGEAITIQTTGGIGGGDILIQPDTDTEGQVIIYSGTTSDNSFTVQNSNITTGSLIYAEAGTSSSGYYLLKLASGSPLTTKFSVDHAGNTDIAGNLTVDSSGFFGGNVGIGTTNPANFKLQVAGDVGPETDSTYDLGSDSIRWANIYADNIYGAVSGSVSFADIASGTNTAASMVVGTGASLGYSGTGTINASSLQGGTWGAPLGIGTTTPGVGYFTTLSASTSLTTPTIDSSGGLAIGTSSQTGLTLGRAEATTTINGSAIVLGTQASSTTHAVRADRSLTAGSGLTGGGNLTADRTFNVGAGNGISVNADDVAVNQGYNFAWTGTQSWSNTATFNGNLFFGGSTGLLSSTGNVGIGHTSPAFKLQIAGSGNLLSIGDTAGNTFFSVTDSLITSNLPHTFTSSGDVSMAYNLIFTNQVSSKIESYGPFSLVAGESHESNNLTLKTYNAGKLIVDSANFWVDSANVGIGTTSPSYTLDVNGDLGIALGSDLYLGGVGLGGTGGAGLVGLNNAGLTYVSSSTVQEGIADLDSALGGVSGDIRWVMTGNSGTPQIVGAGQTASFLGGTGISTSVGATRQLTITNTAPWTDSSGSYIQNQFASAQTGNFWISGTGLVGTRLGVGATHPSYSLYTTGNLGVGGTAYFADRVGIGTASPGYTLDVSNAGSMGLSNRIAAPTNSQSLPGSLEFEGRGWNTTSGSRTISGQVLFSGNYSTSTGSVEPFLTFSLRGSGGSGGAGPDTLTERMRITNLGSLGIGTTSPLQRLHVSGGDINIDSGYGIRINNTATAGNVLRGDGTRFVSSVLSGSDITGAALSKTDDTNVTLTLTGSPSTALLRGVGVSVSWSGQLAIARGGTNSSATPTAGGVAYGTGSAYAFTSAGNAGQLLQSNAAGAPTWIDASGVGTNYWQRNGTTLTPLTATDNLTIGSTTSTSARLYVPGNTNQNAWFNLGTGNLGVGTTSPSQKLTIEGNVEIRTGTTLMLRPTDNSWDMRLKAVGTGSNTILGFYSGGDLVNPRMSITSPGNVGIGTTSPSFKLQIAGSGNLLSIGDTAGNTFFSVTDSLITSNLPHTFTSSGDVSMAYNLLFTNPAASYIRSSAPLYIEAGETYGSSNLTLRTYNTGDIILESANLWADGSSVGIGTTDPSQELHVNGDIRVTGGYYDSENSIGSNGDVLTSTGVGTTWSSVSDLSVGNADTLDTLDSTDFLRATASDTFEAGNTLTINGALDVNGAVTLGDGGDDISINSDDWDISSAGVGSGFTQFNVDNLRLDGNTLSATNASGLYLYDDGSNGIFIEDGGNVGVGTGSPGAKLEVRQDMSDYDTAFTAPHLSLRANNSVDNTGFVGITYDASTVANYGWSSGALRSSSGQSSFVWKYHNNSAEGTERMRIDQTGNVGIGTTNPGSYKLNVAGNTYLGGTLTTTGAITAPTSTNTINSLVINAGTITSGTWQATAIAPTYGGTGDNTSSTTGVPYITAGNWQYESTLDETRGGTGLSSYSTGDLLYASGTDTLGNLGIGTTGQILTVSGGVPVWADSSGLGTDDQTLAEVLTEGNTTSGNNIVMSTTDELRFYDDDTDQRIYASADGTLNIASTNLAIDTSSWDISTAGVGSGFTQFNVDNLRLDGNTLSATNASGLYLYDDGSNGIFVEDGGNVGIGTTDPLYKLDVNGSAAVTGSLKILGSDVMETTFSPDNWTMKNIFTGNGWARNLFKFTDSSNTIYFSIGGYGSGQSFYNAYIGTAYNQTWQTWDSSEVVINENSADIDFRVESDNDSNALFVEGSSGNVGIGTTEPSYKTHITASNPTLGLMSLNPGEISRFSIGGQGDNTGRSWHLRSYGYTAGPYSNYDAIWSFGDVGNTHTSASFHIMPNPDTPVGLSVINSGNVGIGTSDPGSYKLNVAGNTYIDGALTTTGAITAPTSTNTINNLVINSGTISSGTWQATAIGATYGGTGQTAYNTGDLLYASSGTALSKRGIGTTGQVLTVSGGVPVWSDPVGGITGSGSGSGSGGQATFWTGSDSISGDNAFWWDNTNKSLGIGGTPSSAYKLDVLTGNMRAGKFVDGSNSNYYLDPAEAVSLLTAGNAGIGTASTDYRLDVRSGTTDSVAKFFSSDDLGQILVADNDTTAYLGAKDSKTFLGLTSGLSSNNLVVDNVGNVGVGTIDPGSKLHVYSSRSDSPADMYNIRSVIDITGAPTTVRAFDMRVNNNATSGTITNLQGQYTEMNITNNASVTNVKNYTTWGTKQGTGTVSNWTLFDASNPNKTAGAITNLYGLKIADLTAGTNNWSIYTGSAPSYFGGNVGIGVSNPSSGLHVVGADARLTLQATGGRKYFLSTSSDMLTIGRRVSGDTVDAYDITIFNSGNVGIGTTNPQAKLDIGGASSTISNTSGDITINSASNNISFAGDNLINISNLYLSGNLGIGTTGPTQKTHIQTSSTGDGLLITKSGESSSLRAFMYEALGPSLEFRDASDATIHRIRGYTGYPTFFANGGGNVGIGTSAPSGTFEVAGFMRSTAIGTIPTAGKGTEVFYHTSQDLGYVLAYDRSASAYRPLRIEGSSVQINSGSGGSVGIGTASPQTTLHAAGNVMADNIFYFGYNTGGGSALCYSASGTYSGYNFVRPCTSLAELKDNVQDLNLGLETIMQLTPRTFNWKEDGSADLGFIAEEIEAVNPLLAVYTRGELIGVKYQNLTALLAKGMQEQQKQIETTSQKVALLDNDLSITRSGDLSVELLQEDYQVRNISTGQIVKRVGALGEAVFGKARVGLIETIDIVADAVNARQIKSDRLLSPIIETEEVRLTNQDSKIKTANQNSKLSIVNSANQPTAEFNTETKTTTLFGDLTVAGNIGVGRSINAGQLSAQGATFGDLLAQNVGIGKLEAEEISTQKLDVAQDATIAGTLYVDRIIARDGGFGELLAKNISIDSIKSIIREEIALSQEEATGPDKPLQEQEEELNIDQLLAEVESWLNLNTGSDLPIDGQTSLVENQITTLADHSVYQGSLTVLGQTTLSHVFIGDQLTVGSLVLANNSLNNPNGTLYLQKEGLGGLDVLNGKFMIDNEGNIFIAQHLTVGGDLVAGNIRPHEGENLTFDLANSIGQGNETPDQAQDDEEQLIQSEEKGFGKLLVRGINQETVVQIDASGSAKFAGTISTDSLSISKQEGDNENLVIAASENLENINIWAPGITTNASAGEAVLPVGQTDLIVYNDRLTEESMIYLTPTSDTKNQVLYIKAKVAKTTTEAEDQSQTEISYFVVGINQPINEEVRFNWWIIGNN